MFLENYSNYMDSLKTSDTVDNIKKVAEFLERLAMMHQVDLISIGLSSYGSYLNEVAISLSETKEDVSLRAQWLINVLYGFARHLFKEQYISKLNFTPFEKEYYELETTLKEGLKSYKKENRLGMMPQDFKFENGLVNSLYENVMDRIHDLNDPKHILELGVHELALGKKFYNEDVKAFKKELRKDVEFDDHDIYLLNNLINFINISSKYKYSLDDAMVMLNKYNGK